MIRTYLIKTKYKNCKFYFYNNRINRKISISCKNNCCLNLKRIWAGAGNVEISMNDNSYLLIDDDVCLGSNCKIFANNSIIIEKNVMIGPNVVISEEETTEKVQDRIYIGESSWIGANVVICRGSHIGKNCVIGAGAVINSYIKDNSIVISKFNSMKEYVRHD